jgi:cell shape-determining protein MreC
MLLSQKSPFFTFVSLDCLRNNDKPMELLEEMKRMLSKQNKKIESMYRENQELREEVSFLKAVRVSSSDPASRNTHLRLSWFRRILN